MMSHATSTTQRLLVAIAMLGLRLVPADRISKEGDRLRVLLGRDLVSQADRERIDRGYYEQLLGASAEPGGAPPICEVVADLREVVLRPNQSIIRDNGTSWSTNALGLRDRSYPRSKPSGAFRIAMTGDSIGVGLGVDDGRGFEPLLERRLGERSRSAGGLSVELLNFSVPGRSPGQRWDHFQKVGWATAPDLVLFEATQADVGWDERRLAELLPRGIGWDSPLYGDILRRSGVRPGATSESYARALRPYRWELVAAVYRAVAADCRARGVPCIWVLIPRVGQFVEPAEYRRLVDRARAAGFSAVVDISDAFDGIDPTALELGPNDFHPNGEGHALLAGRLEEVLWPQPALGMLRGKPPRDRGVESMRGEDEWR